MQQAIIYTEMSSFSNSLLADVNCCYFHILEKEVELQKSELTSREASSQSRILKPQQSGVPADFHLTAEQLR